jgi:hypothetical protein
VNPWPIKPLTPADLGFDVDNYDFSGFTGDQLSSTPSLEGFLDNTLLDSLADLNDQTILIASMASQLDDVYTVLDELGNDDLESLFGDLTSAASAGDSLLADYGSSFSTGGSGGGGGTPAGTPCGDLGNAGGTVNLGVASAGAPASTQLLFTNQKSNAVTITQATLTQDPGGPWTWTSSVPVTVQPGQQGTLGTIALDTSQLGSFVALLTLTYADGTTLAACIQASVQMPSPTGGGAPVPPEPILSG